MTIQERKAQLAQRIAKSQSTIHQSKLRQTISQAELDRANSIIQRLENEKTRRHSQARQEARIVY